MGIFRQAMTGLRKTATAMMVLIANLLVGAAITTLYAVSGNHTETVAAGIFLLAISGLAVAIRRDDRACS